MSLVFSGIFALLVGLLVFASYRQGIKDGRSMEQGAPVTPLFAPAKNRGKGDKSEEEKLLEWADSYEG